jgi:hypothetical protein
MMASLNFDFSQSFDNVLNTVVNWIPNVVEFLVVIILGYFVALIVRWIVSHVLRLLRLNQFVDRGVVGGWIVGAIGKPSRFVGKIAFWVTWFGSVGVADSLAHLPEIGNLVSVVYSYLPHVLSALFIFVLAVGVSAAISTVVKRTMGDTPTGKIVGSVVPVLVLSMAGFAILNALRISPAIVQITYGAMMGALALGLALAFGLGGRDVAAKMLEDAYKTGQKQSGQVKKDVQKGVKTGQKEAAKMQSKGRK